MNVRKGIKPGSGLKWTARICLVAGNGRRVGFGRDMGNSGLLIALHTHIGFPTNFPHGSIPEGLNICHTCDNPGCVNPAHLFVGSQSDNIRDMYNKGRGVDNSGEKNGLSKLTDVQVNEIRERYTGKYGEQTALAKEYGVTPRNIGSIVNNKHWKE